MRRPFPTLAAALVLTLAGGGWSAAWAQPAPAVTPDGARELESAIGAGLGRWLAAQGKDGDLTILSQGDPTVTVDGDHYAVTLPPLTTAGKEGDWLEIGAIRLVVRPLSDARYAFEARLPATLPIRNGEDQPAGTVTIGRQSVSGVWSRTYETALSFDASLGDVAVEGTGDHGLAIGSLTLMQDLRPDGPSTWSGPAAMALSDLSMWSDEGEEGEEPALRLKGLTAEATVARMDLGKANRFAEMAADFAGGAGPSAGLVDTLRTILGEASGRLRLTGLTFDDPESDQLLRVEHIAVNSGVSGLDSGRGSMTLGFEGRGITAEPEVAPSAFTPDSIDVQLTLADLPNDALWQGLTDLLVNGQRKGAKARAAVSAAGDRLIQAMTEAGTTLRIDRLRVDTPSLGARTSGSATAAKGAVFGAVADVTVELSGLDAAAEALRPKGGRQPDEDAQEALGVIAMLQAMGRPAEDEAGTDVRTYRLQLAEQGQILLNGADMGAMFAGMSGGRKRLHKE